MAYTLPKDWTAAEVVTAANMNAQLRDNLKHIAGTSGFTATPSATRGIEPLSGYFMGALAVNRHIESGTDTTAGGAPGTKAVTFSNAYAANPIVIVNGAVNGDQYNVSAIATTGFTALSVGTGKAFNWIAEGSDV